MSSSHSSAARPVVPPKPEKDNRPLWTIPSVSPELGLNSRQTIGTQVNMLRKASPTSSSASRFQKDDPSTTSGNSETTKDNNKGTVTSPKPALPPKPSAFKKVNTSSQVQKLTSSIAATDSPSPSEISHLKDQNSTNDQHQNSKNIQFKSTTKVEQVGPAPVASIDEFDNLSDLNSPSPIRHMEITSPRSQLSVTKSPPKSAVTSPRKFGNFEGRVNSNANNGNIRFDKPLPPIPPASSKPKNFTTTTNNNTQLPFPTKGSPPVSPRRVANSSGAEGKFAGGHVFQFPHNNNIHNTSSSIFTAQQIQERQGKSASLGRSAAPINVTSITSNFKKSVTLSRVAPLDLSTHVKKPSSIQTAPILLGSQNNNSSRLNFGRPISFSTGPANSTPPPPPPRMRKSQRGLSLMAGQDKSPTSPTTSGCDILGIPDKPVYATVDKERKWAARLQKKQEEEEENGKGNAIHSDGVIETVLKTSTSDNEESVSESIVNSSLTITTRPSWLGKQFIDCTTSESQSAGGGGSVINSVHQVDSVSSTEAVGKSMIHQATNNSNFVDSNIHGNVVNSTLQKQQSQHLIYTSTTTTNNNTAQYLLTETSINNNRIQEGEETIEQINTKNQKEEPQSTITRLLEKGQEKDVNDSPVTQTEKEGLCRNESFLYAMQDTELKGFDQLEKIQDIPSDDVANLTAAIRLVSVDGDTSNNNTPYPASTTHVECEEKKSGNPFMSSHPIDDTGFNFVEQDAKSKCEASGVSNSDISKQHQSMDTINVSVIPNRESVLDVFEKELEIQLESLESFCSSQVVPSSPSSVIVNFHEGDQRSISPPTMGASQGSCVKPDPRTSYLEFVDCRLQSIQSLLENIVTSPEVRRSVLPENNENISKSTTREGHVVGFEIPGMQEYMEDMETGETEGQNNHERRQKETPRPTDGDIVTDILLSSKKFEGSGLSSRCALEVHNNTPIDEDKISAFQRRSWNCDYSPSQSDSSSSSSSRCRSNHQHRRSCDFSSVSESGGPSRRKHVCSSWIDIGEDELSTGALGDAESSDAVDGLIPSSTEDIEGHGDHGKVVTRRKRGLVNSLFSSFGKSGASSHSSNIPSENRSKFFLDSPSLEQSQERGGHKEKDRTRSLPVGNVFDHPPPRRPHRALHRTSGGSSQLSNADNQQVDLQSPIENSQQCFTPATGDVLMSLGSPSTITRIFADSEQSNSSRSSICYDELLGDLNTKQRKAFFVARELLTSERTFVDVLNLLTVDFPLALKLASDTIRLPVIGPNDLDFILGGLPTLKGVNEVLMSELEERISSWKENPKIADIIVKTGPFLKHYSTYVRDFERIVQRLDYCCTKYGAFAKTLKEFEASDRCQKLGLKHYMLKPVQRMPQYRLLLEDYLKTLEESSEDYNDTVKAIAIVKEVAEHANEAINLQINAEKLMNLQNRLPNIIVLKTNRFLLKEGELLKVCRKELQPRYFALMTDVLLCMTYNASTGSNIKDLKLRYDLPLAGMRISSKFPNEDYLNEFSVISTTRSFNLVAKSAKERDDWMKALSSAILNNIKKRACTTPDIEKEFRIGAEAPVWIQDKRVTMCQVCTAEFTVTFRRHHCRACGKCVCSNCSGNQAPLKYLGFAAARVCEACYEHLLEEFDQENREKNTESINEIRMKFKRVAINTTSRANRQRKSIPDKFKVQGINSDSRISGYLQWREKKAWKRHWFVLMDRVLYVYAASEDIVAMRTIPVLGYQIESVADEVYTGVDPQLMFRLTHSGVSHPLVFMAENYSSVEKWIEALKEATVLT